MSRQEKSLEAKTQLLEISGKLRVFHANLQTEVAKLGLKKKLTDLDFADAFGFSVNQIQKWESGETEIPARYFYVLHGVKQSTDEVFSGGRVTIPEQALRELFSMQKMRRAVEETIGYAEEVAAQNINRTERDSTRNRKKKSASSVSAGRSRRH